MTRKNKKVIIAVFICVFIFLVSYTKAQKEYVSNETTISDKIEYKAERLRDPFQGESEEIEEIKQLQEQEAQVKPLPPLNIQGIVWGGRFPQAIINNKVVKIGDTIGEVRISNISSNGVTVFFENRQYNLSSPASLNLESIKKSPEGGKYGAQF